MTAVNLFVDDEKGHRQMRLKVSDYALQDASVLVALIKQYLGKHVRCGDPERGRMTHKKIQRAIREANVELGESGCRISRIETVPLREGE